jgi:hypothetical protein
VNSKDHALDEVYMRLLFKDDMPLKGGDVIRVGSIEFLVCRFNVGRAEDIGTKNIMEDKSVCI